MEIVNLTPAGTGIGPLPEAKIVSGLVDGTVNFDGNLVDRFYILMNTFNSMVPAQDGLYLWGCLVKTWATGKNHFPGKDPNDMAEVPARPATIAQFKAALNWAGIAYHLPDRFTNLQITQSDADTLAIRLPAKDAVLSREKGFKTEADERYALPPYYGVFYGAQPPRDWGADGDVYVHTLRVGEYSMNNCA